MSYVTRIVGPFLIGLIVGSTLWLTSPYWLADTEALIRVLAVIAGLLLTFLLVIWFVYRWFVSRLLNPDLTAFSDTWRIIREKPQLVVTRHFWSEQLAPIFVSAGPALAWWFSFAAALGMVTLILTNILLLATLLVQTLSAERLGIQNELLTEQNSFMRMQSRVDTNRLLQEEVARLQLYNRRWGELHAFRLTEYGYTQNDKFISDRIGDNCVPADCSKTVDLTQSTTLAHLVLERLAKRKEEFLDELETVVIRDPTINRESNISDMAFAILNGSADCFGKEENILEVVEDFETFLRFEFAASAFKKQSSLDLELQSAKEQLSSAYNDFRMRFDFRRPPLNEEPLTWGEFPDTFASAVEHVNHGIVEAIEHCEYATKNSDSVIEELRNFLASSAPSINQ